jgi:serralysin
MFDNAVGGADTFVFALGGGDDEIGDFRQSDHDKIDVGAYGFTDITDMTLSDLGTDTLIEFGASGADNSVTLLGFADPGQLTDADFIFA